MTSEANGQKDFVKLQNKTIAELRAMNEQQAQKLVSQMGIHKYSHLIYFPPKLIAAIMQPSRVILEQRIIHSSHV
jgi:hypothetical protein